MDGYDDRTYGDAFADVYDDWYGTISDVDATVATLLGLASGGPILELGVGTGRLAIPLAAAGRDSGVSVTGIDSSAPMLERLTSRDVERLVTATQGSMVHDLPRGPFALAFAAYNTLFNLRTEAEQQACFHEVAARLREGGRFVVETFVPDDGGAADDVSVRTLEADRVVLSVSVRRPEEQVAEGQFIEITEAGGVRLRPWSIRYASVDQLDGMAANAGFGVEHRWASFASDAFDASSDRQVSVYRRN